MGKLEDFRRHFPPIMAWTSLQGDSISQDGPRGWGVVNLEKKKGVCAMPKPACEQVIAASGKGWWCCGSCWCHLFVSRFELEFVPKPPPRGPLKALREVPGEDKQKKKEVLPALRQDKKGKAAPGSFA